MVGLGDVCPYAIELFASQTEAAYFLLLFS